MKVKKINITNEKELNNFYKKIWLYKSIFYRNITFKLINEDKYDIKEIIEALNIKSRIKRIEYIFDKTCDYIDNYYKGENICGFRCGKCYSDRANKKKNKCNGCCYKCKHITDQGCPSKNISCKLFNCSEVKSRYKTVKFNELKLLKLYNWKQRIMVKHSYFRLKEDVIIDLYINFFCINAIKNLYTIISMMCK